MASGASFRSPSNNVGRHPWLCRILMLLMVFLSANGFAQQAAPNHGSASQPAKTSPLLQEADELLRQGSIAEAKIKIQTELQQNPSSVEAYNLLGIAFSDEKDYANSLQSFQHALKLDPNSTRTRNNIGNLYVAQEKLDLAEKEFAAVLRQEPGNRDANYSLGRFLIFSASTLKIAPLASI
jgi:Tfp pilus assembly protein PilF